MSKLASIFCPQGGGKRTLAGTGWCECSMINASQKRSWTKKYGLLNHMFVFAFYYLGL